MSGDESTSILGSFAGQKAFRDPRLWRLRAVICFQMMAMNLLIPFEGIWMKQQGMGETLIGKLGAVSTILGFIAGLYWAQVADRTRRPDRIALFGYLGLALTTFTVVMCAQTWQFVIYSAARGLFGAMAFNLIPLMVMGVLKTRNHPVGSGYASYRMFGSVGFIFAGLVLPRVVPEVAYLLLVTGGLLLLAALPLWGFGEEETEHRTYSSVRELLADRSLMWIMAAAFFYTAASPAIYRFSALHAKNLGADAKFIGIFTAIQGASAVVGVIVAGRIADRKGVGWLMWAALTTQALRTACYAAAPSYAWLALPQVLHMASWATMEIGGTLQILRNAPAGNRATAMAMFMGAQAMGMVAGGVMSGYFAENQGYPMMFLITAVVAALALPAYAISCRCARIAANQAAPQAGDNAQ